MLDVYLDTTRVGILDEHAQGIRFTYTDHALNDPTRLALSVRLPVRAEAYETRDAAPFFDNLLPEGEARDLLANTLHQDPRHTYALLGEVGGECAGAVSLWPQGETPPGTPSYTDCSAADLERLFGHTSDSGRDETLAAREARQSMSGTQPKLAVLKEGARYRLPHAGAPTTVLLKRERARYPALAANEIVSLQLMALAGVPIATGAAIPALPGVFESIRYDRFTTLTGIRRLHQEDLCQATGRLPKDKYAAPNAKHSPTYDDIKTVLLRHTARPIEDLAVVARWAVANICIGNNDAHMKNLSILYSAEGIRLAPAYDVVCTAAYPQLDDRFALAFGGVFTVSALDPTILRKFARSLNFAAPAAAALVDDVTSRIAAQAQDIFDSAGRQHGAAVTVLDNIRAQVAHRTSAVREKLLSQR